MLSFGIIDSIIQEPLGGAHRNTDKIIAAVGKAVHHALNELSVLDSKALITQRQSKYLNMGKKGIQ